MIPLPIVPSSLGPRHPWDDAWRRSRSRLLSRLSHTRVLDYVGVPSFEQDGDVAAALSHVGVIRRQDATYHTLPADVTVDVLRLRNWPAGANAADGMEDAEVYENHQPYGRVGRLDDARGEVVLVLRLTKGWIRRPMANLYLGNEGEYAAPGVRGVSVLFRVEGEDEGQGDSRPAAPPNWDSFILCLWRAQKPLQLVGLDDVNDCIHTLGLAAIFATSLETLDARGERVTDVRFLSAREYEAQVGPEHFELYTSTPFLEEPVIPSAPAHAEPEDTVPRLVALSLWKAGASAEDKSTVLHMRQVSKRWCWDADSAIFRHVSVESRNDVPGKDAWDEFARGLFEDRHPGLTYVPFGSEEAEALLAVSGPTTTIEDSNARLSFVVVESGSESESEASDTGPPQPQPRPEAWPDLELQEIMWRQLDDVGTDWGRGRYGLGHASCARYPKRTDNIVVLSSPAGRLPLLFNWWSLTSWAGIAQHKASLKRLEHLRVLDVRTPTTPYLAEVLRDPPHVEVVRCLCEGRVGKTTARRYVYAVDGTSQERQIAPGIDAFNRDHRRGLTFYMYEAGSTPSLTVSILYDPMRPRRLRNLQVSFGMWGADQIDAFTVLLTPVVTRSGRARDGA